jgi:hypothetical protein
MLGKGFLIVSTLPHATLADRITMRLPHSASDFCRRCSVKWCLTVENPDQDFSYSGPHIRFQELIVNHTALAKVLLRQQLRLQQLLLLLLLIIIIIIIIIIKCKYNHTKTSSLKERNKIQNSFTV